MTTRRRLLHLFKKKLSHSLSAPARCCPVSQPGLAALGPRSRYHEGRRPSNDDSFHSPTVIPQSALDKPSIMKRYHLRRTCSHTSPRRSPTMVTLHDTGFVECRWWNDGWTVKTVVGLRDTGPWSWSRFVSLFLLLFLLLRSQL